MSVSLYRYNSFVCDGTPCCGDCDYCVKDTFIRKPISKETAATQMRIGGRYYVESKTLGLMKLTLDAISKDKNCPDGYMNFGSSPTRFGLSLELKDYGKTWRVWGEVYLDEPEQEDIAAARWE